MDSPSSSLTCSLFFFFFFLCIFTLPFVLPSSLTATALAAAAAVPFPKDAIPTMSGYIPVNVTSRSTIYFAYYEAQQPKPPLPSTPLLVWLQGGPGCSSMIGNFFELGPWLVVANSTAGPVLVPNPHPWNRHFGLLFLDNPIGSGFSVAAHPSEIPRDEAAVAGHLWVALQAFLSYNSSFRSRPLYLTGESYAGKFVSATGYHILQQNARVVAARRINLLGVAIGNGLVHPVAQVRTHADSAHFSGLINERQKAYLDQLQVEAVNLTLEERWAAATHARNRVLKWLQNATGLASLFDLSKTRPYRTGLVGALLANEEVKAALRVEKGAEWDKCSAAVKAALREDVMKSVKDALEGLVRRVRVLLYQGWFDLREGVPSTEAWVRELQWEGLEGFLRAERSVWTAGKKKRLAGYVQTYETLSQVVVARAGHMAPADQRLSTQVMIQDWVLHQGLFGGAQHFPTPASDKTS